MTERSISTSGPQNAIPFGAYLLLKRLAVGGMAELFLARDTRNGRLVVLKRILPYLAEEAEFVRMFLDEARIAAALHHPSIVELFELGHLEGSTFIAMEWVDGVDLRKVLQKEQERSRVVPPGIAAWIVARLCEGLHHAHFARAASGELLGIIHRDVSPQNVMVSFDAAVKLVDFGIAKATAWMSRSKPGVIKGKFLYLAPEQLTTEPLDHRTDLFAIGTMLYELTTGQSPFYRTSTEAVIYAIRMEEPDPPERVRKGFPTTLANIIIKCLVKDRTKRYQSGAEIAQALDDFVRTEAPTSRADVVQYISTLYGDSSERTSIYIPPNAKRVGDDETARAPGRSDSRTDTSTQREGPFDRLDEEHTVPLDGSMIAAATAGRPTEGRRVTNGIDAVPTDPTRPERPRALMGERPATPWEPEVTAPMPRPPARPAPPVAGLARRDFQATAELDRDPALADDLPPTSVSLSGSREVPVGGAFAPLMPTMVGDTAGELQPVPDAPRPAPKFPPARPPPPVASADSLPEVSAVSAGDATLGTLMGDSSGETSGETSEPSEPSPPAPSTRAPPRRSITAQVARRPRPIPSDVDPDDEVATVERPHEYSVRTQKTRKLQLGVAAAITAAVFLVLLLLLWPDSPAEPAPPPSKPDAAVATPAPPPQPVVTSALVKVQVRAQAGTTLSLDGKPLAPDTVLERLPGELVLKFTCPAKKKGARPVPSTLRAQIPSSAQLVAVDVPCQ